MLKVIENLGSSDTSNKIGMIKIIKKNMVKCVKSNTKKAWRYLMGRATKIITLAKWALAREPSPARPYLDWPGDVKFGPFKNRPKRAGSLF